MNEIKIGSQIWAQEDLKVMRFRNGDFIPVVQNPEEWERMESAAMCINPDTGAYFYNWYAVNDPRGLAPKGWHIPSDAEWTVLTDYLGGKDLAGLKMKSSWCGDNSSGFSGLPGGYRYSSGAFNDAGYYGFWWSSSPSSSYAWSRILYSNYDYVKRIHGFPQNGFSVRCVKGEVVSTAPDEYSARLDEIALKLDQLQRDVEAIRASKKP